MEALRSTQLQLCFASSPFSLLPSARTSIATATFSHICSARSRGSLSTLNHRQIASHGLQPRALLLGVPAAVRDSCAAMFSSPAFAIEEQSAGAGGGAAPAAGNALADTPPDNSLLVSVLAFAAFVGLVFLTVAVIYLAVSDFYAKRASEAEVKALDEKLKTKKKRSDSAASARGGPKGFGKKFEDEV